ncbi:unnamed protein product [Lymnaea stagnalis]|uniref:Axonemal 84 kDa protein n=1 Tax=Lymnaea stagnalis TaxID=6523 RepID=A0AAV2IMM7_LYMST
MADAGKKGKMSKAEKDKLKKEEQERKAFEEEAARMQAQEEAKLKKKEEAIMAVERVKLENEERRRRRVEMSDLQIVLASVSMQIRQFHSVRRQNEKWARYMKCDGSPDPTNQGEINTYINLRLEDKTRDDSISVLADSVLDLNLIKELQQLLEDSPHDELSDIQRSLYHETIQELQNLIAVKLDLATLQILCDATVLADPETGNLQHIIKNDQIILCAWGNIMKNPRVKSFEFPEIHFTFDIPRILGLSDCAVRLMNTKFDHLSPTSKAVIPRFKRNKAEIPAPTLPEENKGPKESEEEGPKEEGEKMIETKEGSSYDVSQGLSRISGTDDEPKTEEEQEVVEALEEDFPDPPTPEPLDFDDFDEDDDIVDLRAYDVLGGVFTFNLLHLPPQPKAVGAWTITQLVDPPQIEVYEYMADPPQTHEDNKKDKEKDRKDDKPPIGVSMLLPAHAVFLESPTVARWDYDRKLWSTKGFSDQNFNENTRTFSFKTTHFGTFCLLQDTHINMPFQSWTLRPHRLNSAVLTITAAILEVEIEIKDGLCALSQPKDRPELAHIIDRWLTTAELIKVMRQAGVNIFPNEDSLKFVAIQSKNALIEDRLYHQMALTASALAFTWTKWNAERSKNEFVFQAVEALEDEPIMEENWSMFMATKRRVMKLRVSEYDDSFSQSQEINPSEYKSNLYHLMNDIGSKTTLERIETTSYFFINCVYQLLKATKVLTYS